MLKEVEYKDYIIRELSIGQFLPLLAKLGDNFQQTQLEMLSEAIVHKDTNIAVGSDGLFNIGASDLKPIWNIVAEMHGLIEKKDD